MHEFDLTYIITTYNKLKYLSVTLPLLISSRQQGEEIIVIDGASSDGTAGYCDSLYRNGAIDQFISEPDHGEAHGINKALLRARGTLVKIITDDDIFFYPGIRRCKEFMLADPTIDILGFDGFGFNTNHLDTQFSRTNAAADFIEWKNTGKPFMFCGLSFMMRRSSLAYMGLFNVTFKIVDFEYAIRVTSMKTRIAFFTGPSYVNIVNARSNSHQFYETIARERKLLSRLYPAYRHKVTFRGTIMKLKDLVATSLLKKQQDTEYHDYHEVVARAQSVLAETHTGSDFTFLS